MAAANEPRTRTLVSQVQLDRPAGRTLYWTVFWTLMVLFAAVFLFPLYWMVTGGLKSGQEIIQTPPTVVPHHAHPSTTSRPGTTPSSAGSS